MNAPKDHQADLFNDVNCNLLFEKNDQNYIHQLTRTQLTSLKNLSLLDVFLSKGNVIEPHYHPNAAELVYLISGRVIVSVLNPNTNKLQTYKLKRGQVVNLPQGWWHWIIASTDHTHVLTIFNASIPDTVLGSNILSKTPTNVLAYTYCLDELELAEALAPIQPSILLGPPANCHAKYRD